MTESERQAQRAESLRKIDALVATHIMGWRNIHTHDAIFRADRLIGLLPGIPMGVMYSRVPLYTSDIAEAMQVVGRMAKLGWRWIELYGEDGSWRAEFKNGEPNLVKEYHNGDSAAEAICRAALKAVGVELRVEELEGENS